MLVADVQRGVLLERNGIMDAIGEYILSVAAATILCSVARRMLEKKKTPNVVAKLLTSLFMTYTILSPLVGISVGSMGELSDAYERQASAAVAEGENYASENLQKSIKAQLEAYVLEKAEDLGADIQVSITLSDELYPVPRSIRITGQIGPYAKTRLKQIIEEDLGVLEAQQIWT